MISFNQYRLIREANENLDKEKLTEAGLEDIMNDEDEEIEDEDEGEEFEDDEIDADSEDYDADFEDQSFKIGDEEGEGPEMSFPPDDAQDEMGVDSPIDMSGDEEGGGDDDFLNSIDDDLLGWGEEDDMPMDDMPVDDMGADDAPMDDMPMDDMGSDDMPMDDMPVDDMGEEDDMWDFEDEEEEEESPKFSKKYMSNDKHCNNMMRKHMCSDKHENADYLDDAMQLEDALFAIENPNASWEELNQHKMADPVQPGAVGFAPAQRLGSIGTGITMDDISSEIPTMESVSHKEEERRLPTLKEYLEWRESKKKSKR